MRRYTYATNSYYKTASIIIEDAPRWVFAFDKFIEIICSCILGIRLPNITFKLKDELSIEINDGEPLTTLKDWYGDFSQLFCCVIHNPISNFCYARMDTRFIKVDYDKLKEAVEKYDKNEWRWESFDDDE